MTREGAPPEVYDSPPLVRNPPDTTRAKTLLPIAVVIVIAVSLFAYINTPMLWIFLIALVLALTGIACYRKNDGYSWWIGLVLISLALSFFLSLAARFPIAYSHALAITAASIPVIIAVGWR